MNHMIQCYVISVYICFYEGFLLLTLFLIKTVYNKGKTHHLVVIICHLEFLQLFDWMRRHGKTNIASYSSYIKFVGRDSNAAKALEIYNSIKDDSTRSNVSVCNSTLSCLIKCGKFNSSLKLFNQMKQAGLIPDIVTYSTVCYSMFNTTFVF